MEVNKETEKEQQTSTSSAVEAPHVAVNPYKSLAILTGLVVALAYGLYVTVVSFNTTTKSTTSSNKIIKSTAPLSQTPGNALDLSKLATPALPKLPDLLPPKPIPPASNPENKATGQEQKTNNTTQTQENNAQAQQTSAVEPPIQAPLAQPILAPIPTPAFQAQKSKAIDLPKQVVSPLATNQVAENKLARRKTGIILLASSNSSSPTNQESGPQTAKVEIAKITQDTSAFTNRSNLKYLLGKSKVIELILETAINTDQPGEVRAIVSRDVFAEDGKTRLIPKGSRAFGTFEDGFDDSLDLIKVNWNRVDLASGYSITLSAQSSVDNLGRKGAPAYVDRKYKEKLLNAAISSAVEIGLSKGVDYFVNPQSNTVMTTKYQGLSNALNRLQLTITADQNSITAACGQITGGTLFFDTTIPDYTTLTNTCNQILVTSPPVDAAGWAAARTTLITALQTASQNVLTLSQQNTTATLTATQSAVQSAAKNIVSQMKGAISEKQFKPNATIAQGEIIRMYVDRDYLFPQEVVEQDMTFLQ